MHPNLTAFEYSCSCRVLYAIISLFTVTNPFLEADRQMKEMVAKNKKGGHLQDNLTNNQVEKGKTSNSVDLDDVKISNILRESEVMGGTAGISSILQTQTTENELDDGQIRQGEVRFIF